MQGIKVICKANVQSGLDKEGNHMENEKDIESIIQMLDNKVSAGVSRIKVEVEENSQEGVIKEAYHHGRCDVGSAWANGKVRNFDC